jgi:signal transduction histidine kinase
MFYRSRRGGDRVPGTGLGLFIVRALVKRQKGKVRVESPGAGRGTTFHITLPRTPAPEERA